MLLQSVENETTLLSMSDVTIYYNPHCGTCRTVKEILEKKGHTPRLIEYLKTPPSVAELDALLKKLKVGPEDLVRKKEPFYKEKLAGRTLSRAEWLAIFHENPVLIERPVVVMGSRAVVARPPAVLDSWL
jgi:arsenate reductase